MVLAVDFVTHVEPHSLPYCLPIVVTNCQCAQQLHSTVKKIRKSRTGGSSQWTRVERCSVVTVKVVQFITSTFAELLGMRA